MLTFLRKIRRSLIHSGSTRKYLLYSIGEITLVVIGILIALQINNWNDRRNQEQRLEVYLLALTDALKDDLEYLNFLKEVNIFRARSIQYLQEISDVNLTSEEDSEIEVITLKSIFDEFPAVPDIFLGKLPTGFNKELIDLTFSYLTRPILFSINKQAFDELKSTGMFSLISNAEFKKTINDYYVKSESHFSPIKEAALFNRSTDWTNYLRDEIGIKSVDFYKMENPVTVLKKYPKSLIYLSDFKLSAKRRVRRAQDMESRAHEVLIEIEKYLDEE